MQSVNKTIQTLGQSTLGTEYEGRLYLVGGCVRDSVMGLPMADDLDLVTDLDAPKLALMLWRSGISEHHPVIYERFGTAKIQVAGHDVELVSARAESYDPKNRKPDVRGASLVDDAFRRDFTINSLMRNLHTGELLDLTGLGQTDLAAKLIRTPIDPVATFYDDPLRMLRAIRFAVRFGFRIDEQTLAAMRSQSHRLDLITAPTPIVSAERIRDEWTKILLGPAPALGVRLLSQCGLLKQFIPELEMMRGVTQNEWHMYDVWKHTLKACEFATQYDDLIIRLGVLFHDIGKPSTRTEDEKGIHFYDHEAVGERMTQKILSRLRFPIATIQQVCFLVAMHMRLGGYRPDWSMSAVRRLIRDVAPDEYRLFAVMESDQSAMNPNAPVTNPDNVRKRMQAVNALFDVRSLSCPLDGNQMMELLGIGPGPWIKEAKEFLLQQVIEGVLRPNNIEMAKKHFLDWAYVKGFVGQGETE